MDRSQDPFVSLAHEAPADDFSALVQREVSTSPTSAMALAAPLIGRLQGFDLLEQPLIGGLATSPGQILAARTTVPLRHSMIGRSVVVLFEGSDPQAPIIMGVIEPHPLAARETAAQPGMAIQADGERHHITAEREIVLQCGEASITLTRAGKVIIKGNYILSRSAGYNKIKGAAVDIN